MKRLEPEMNLFAKDKAMKIEAALATPEMRVHAATLRRARIAVEKPMTVHAVDQKLNASELSIVERIALKAAMGRAGLLV